MTTCQLHLFIFSFRGMSKFLKIFGVTTMSFVLLLALFYSSILFKKSNCEVRWSHLFIPTHAISTSTSLNYKLTHFLSEDRANVELLVLGSSMAINNVDAGLLEQKTSLQSYNLSSWGQRMNENYFLLQELMPKMPQLKQVLIPFNVNDFGLGDKFSKKELKAYASGDLKGAAAFDYNPNDYIKEVENAKYLEVRNHYRTLQFDRWGSALLHREEFVISEKRWNELPDYSAQDLESFKCYLDSVSVLAQSYNVKLFVALLPIRVDLRSSEALDPVLEICQGVHFIDLSNYPFSNQDYADCTHLFVDAGIELSDLLAKRILEK
jgi:hypothetical protein